MPALILVCALILLEVGRALITGSTTVAEARSERQTLVQVRSGLAIAEAAVVQKVRAARAAGEDPQAAGPISGSFPWCPPTAASCPTQLTYSAQPLSETSMDSHLGTPVNSTNVNTGLGEIRSTYSLTATLANAIGTVAIVSETLRVQSWQLGSTFGAEKTGANEANAEPNSPGEGDVAGCAGNGCVLNQTAAASDTRLSGTNVCRQQSPDWVCSGAPPNPDPNSYSAVTWHNGETPRW